MAFNKAVTYGESESIIDSQIGLVAKTHQATKAMAKDGLIKAGALFVEEHYASKAETTNPKAENLYELVDGEFVKTSDESKQGSKTYYEKQEGAPVGVVLYDYDMTDYDAYPVAVAVAGRLKADKVSAEAKAAASYFTEHGLYIV